MKLNKIIYWLSKISNASLALVTSLIFCLVCFRFSILYSPQFESLSRGGPIFFSDDRDGWLAFANAFPRIEELKPLSWQLNFWPPGNIAVLSVGTYLTGSLLYGAIFHIFLVSTIQATLTYQCASLFSKSRKLLPLILLATILFHSSFLFRSSFIDTVLTSDYLASICLALGLVISYKYFFEDSRGWPYAVLASLSLALSGYLRVTTYQLTLIAVLGVFLKLTVDVIKKKQPSGIFRRLIAITLITFVLFTPWITYRSLVIYDKDVSRGLQFSAQARFALNHQWDTPSELKENPSLKYMGLGTACTIDEIKCKWLSDRQTQILNGTLKKTLDDEWDLRSTEAIKVLLRNPITWINLKLDYFGQSYFQKSVYDSIDSKFHFSIDLILIVCFIPITLFLLLRMRQSPRKYFVTTTFAFSLFLAGQLLVTQSLLRFFLPSIALLCLSLIFAVHAISSENKDKN